MDSPPEDSKLAPPVPADQASAEPESVAAAESEPEADPSVLDDEPRPEDTLSPAVRRLVRQYDLDITGIHGTGPSGRIRVGDVIGMLGGRTEAGPRASEPRDADERTGTAPPYRPSPAARPVSPVSSATPATPAPTPQSAAATPTTTVFECDLSRVLAHRKQQRRDNLELLLTSYCLVACAEALKAVTEVAGPVPRFGVAMHSADGEPRRTLIASADDAPFASLDDRLRALDRELRAVGNADLAPANLLIHHYGSSGSLLATPTPLGANHAASLGIGRVRREVVVKNVDGDEAARITAVCYVTLTFLPDRVALNRANRFLAQLVRVLEQWPE